MDSVAALLRPWLGSRLVAEAPDFLQALTNRLHTFVCDADTIARVCQTLDSMLFTGIRDMTRGGMRVLLDDGRWMRVRVGDCTIMADELTFLLLAELPRDALHFRVIREYSLRESSLSALRALLTRYAEHQTDEELSALKYVVKTCHPPFRWRGWLE